MTYPPSTTRAAEIKILTESLSEKLRHARAVYMSTPITSGRRFYVELRRFGAESQKGLPPEALEATVIRPNIEHAAIVHERLAQAITDNIIDPTQFDFPGWTQSDYRVFWANVISRLAKLVVFVDGWEYSDGCAYEFLTAVRSQCPTMDERLSPLDVATGFEMLRTASVEIVRERGDAEFISGVLAELKPLLQSRLPAETKARW